MIDSVFRVRDNGSWHSRSLPFFCYIGFLALGEPIAGLLTDSRWIYAIQISAVVAILVFFAREFDELWRPSPSVYGKLPLAVAIGVLVFVAWINLELPLLSIGQIGDLKKGFDPRSLDGEIDWRLATVRIFGAAVVVPVMEELFWRSFITRWIDGAAFLQTDPRRITTKALLLSSLVFGLEHQLWFAGLLAGLAYGWLYRYSGNLWLPIAAHATTNLLLGIWVLATQNWRFW